MEGLEDTFMVNEKYCLTLPSSHPPEKLQDIIVKDLSSEPIWKILNCEVEGTSLKNDEEFYTYVDSLPQDASYLLIDGSIYKGAGIGLYGVLGEQDVILSVRNYLKGRSTAPRLEVEALHSALKLMTYFKIKECTIFSDNAYCVNAINKNWLSKWISEKVTTKKNIPAYLPTWRKIHSMWLPGFTIVHVSGHRITPHNVADGLARGDSVYELIAKLPFQKVKKVYFPTEPSQDVDLRKIAISGNIQELYLQDMNEYSSADDSI